MQAILPSGKWHLLIDQNKVAAIQIISERDFHVWVWEDGIEAVLHRIEPSRITVWHTEPQSEAALQAAFPDHTIVFKHREHGDVLDLVFNILSVI